MCKVAAVVRRSRPPLHLERSPLIYFVAQVRFAPILQMSTRVPAIQDELRKRYPVFSVQQAQTVSVDAAGALSIRNTSRWQLQDKDALSGVVLTEDALTFHTTKYTTYEKTESLIRSALDAVHKFADIGVIERVGLRYVDLVKPGEGETLASYLKPHILGIDAEQIGVTEEAAGNYFKGRTSFGTLVIRFTKMYGGGSPIPPDLQPLSLSVLQSVEAEEIAGLLDFDHFSEQRLDFSIDTAIEALGNLHDAISVALENAATGEAFTLWGKKEVQVNA